MAYVGSTLTIFVGVILRINGEQTEDKPLLINTSYGPIQGKHFISPWTHRTIYAFQGIPYASPPIGELRFKDPIRHGKWSEVKDCTKDKPCCPQTQSSETSLMSEDCLYLNVYTPQVPSAAQKLLPVMVWIHGGSFTSGSSSYDNYGPDLLVAEGIVFVSLNYRLGALGFLTLGIRDAPGNAALKDQRLALQWVQSEIERFGGDPHQVTLFGESAGAVAVHLQYLSPLSVGLFQRAIRDSGSALAYRVRDDGPRYALQLAAQLNCNTEDISEVLRCLRTADYRDIVRAQALVKAPQDATTGLLVWVPSIDKHSSEKPFLPDLPFNLQTQQVGSKIPVLMGVNSDEGIIRLAKSEDEIKNITNNLEYLKALQVSGEDSCPTKVKAEKLKQFYFKDTAPTELNVRGYVGVYTDVLYAYSTVVSARAYQSTAEVYLYLFSFDGEFKFSRIEKFKKKHNIKGVCHAQDLPYLFIIKSINQVAAENSNEVTTWHRMVRMWTNFAKHGTPTVGLDPLLQNVQWLPASRGRTNHLIIDVNLKMTSEDLLAPRAALWDSITFHRCS